METGHVRTIRAMTLSLVVLAACSRSPAFPDTIDLGRQTLTKATSWTREGMAGIVYVPPGQKLPAASPQVGVIISTEHTTAGALHDWVARESVRSGTFQAHQSGTSDESCRVGADIGSETRTFMTLQVCKTGVARAACVEADEVVDQGVFTTCVNDSAACEDVCDERWLARREVLDRLAAEFLTTR